MNKLKTCIPIITPFDKKKNIDFFSLEKLILYISNLNYINYILLFNNFSEINTLSNNEKIDIINCVQNNNKKNIKIILKINNIYNFNDLSNIINQNIYKDINYIILDYPKLKNIYKKEIIYNFNKIFKKYKYIYFFIEIKKKIYINENIFLILKNENNNFIGIINSSNYIFKNYNLIKNIKIFINNDLLFFNNIYYNINGIISPLLIILFNFIYDNFIKNINNNLICIYNKKYYKFIKLIDILYNKLNPISGLKFLLRKINICKRYLKLPCNKIINIKQYNKIEKIFYYINL
ncbi:MAG: hypothetical protein NHF93_01060 [Candidatus Shikimatogenerans bostrichidophilus]|nr:MAG: hypothetical protein NHF93_01060 [Candidatus Shikimatogenerans bostrichidophilus]